MPSCGWASVTSPAMAANAPLIGRITERPKTIANHRNPIPNFDFIAQIEAFAAKVRKPANEMPAYAPEVLSDADLQALYRYVRAIPEPPADLPLR